MGGDLTVGETESLKTANEVIHFLTPKPSPYPLLRIGGKGDGAYLVPEALDGDVACFSPGVAGRKDFEDDLFQRFNIRSHLMDYSSSAEELITPLIQGAQTFTKKWLMPESSADSMSLSEWVQECEPGGSNDLLLQMDIEGAEYVNLLDTPEDVLSRFRILIVEFHSPFWLIREGGAGKTLVEATMNHLSRCFVSVHARANNCCKMWRLYPSAQMVPEVVEVTLLRTDRFSGAKKMYQPQIPHPKDISRNVPRRAPIFLSGAWATHSSGLVPFLKRLADWLNFLSAKGGLYFWRFLRDRLYKALPERVRKILAQLRASRARVKQ